MDQLMHSVPFKKRTVATNAGLSAVVFIISLLFFALLAPLDPDPHHDGYQFAVALAVSEGAIPHVDVFSQYGPVTAEVQGLLLRLTDPTILSLRYFNAVLLALIAVTSLLLAKRLKLSNFSAALVSLAWVALCPAAGVYSDALQLWPWSAVLFTLNAQILLLLLFRGLQKSSSSLIWFLVGFLLILSIWIRLNQGTPLVVAVLIGLLIHPQSRTVLKGHAATLLLGILASVLSGFAYLLLRSDISLFFTDALLGPIDRFVIEDFDGSDRVLAPIDVPAILTQTYFLSALPLLVVGAWIFLLLKRVTTTRVLVAVQLSVAFALLTAMGAIGYFGRPRDLIESISPIELPLDPMNALSSNPLYLAWLLTIFMIGYTVLFALLRPSRIPNPVLTVAIFASAALTTQVIPRWDVYHLWWAGPLLLITVFSFLVRNLPARRSSAFVGVLLLPYVALALFSTYNLLQQPRVLVTEGAMKDMLILPSRADSALFFAELARELPPQSTHVLCADGLAASPGRRFTSDRPNFVSWAWSQAPEPKGRPKSILFCGDEVSDFPPPGAESLRDYKLVMATTGTPLSSWSQTEFRLYQLAEGSAASTPPAE